MRLDSKEIELARKCMEFALEKGADKVRITLTKSILNLVGVLNGEVDKVTHSLDRSLQLNLFVDGKYGTFSSNRFEKEGLEAFITEAISTVRMLQKDPFRNLPAPERQAKDATDGREMDLYDPEYDSMTAERRRALALGSSRFSGELISEEGEYSDSLFDSVTIDSNGLFARHTETSFEIGYEVTVEDKKGNRYSGYWWDATPRLKDLKIEGCSATAIERARAQIGPKGIRSGKYTVVLDSECASKVLTPVLSALGGFPLQQKNSFMDGTLGKKVFPESLTIMDLPHSKGETGARLFDSEGVATKETAIIEKGVVKEYFLNTYMAAKMGLEPTVEDTTRVRVLPVGSCKTKDDVLAKVQDCILVTGFNGGNSNSATGNFSYGIEGFLVKDGKIEYPVKEALMTGDFLTLWNNLIFAAEDARLCLPKLVPSIAFAGVDISA
ncbi:MAG: TldD/PmbA family protein [Bacteroidales bacterium]|nr:TldD/PmbA family protein [Bacteroidales bacterium]